MTYLPSRTLTQQTDVLAQYLRDDDLHCAKNVEGSNLRKVLIGLASEFLRFRAKVDEVYDEYDANQTTNLIEEWEKTVGIPDDCFGNTGTIEQRRMNVLLKLAGVNATTATQFENIALVLGFTVIVTSGVDESTLPQTLPFILLNGSEAPYIIIVDTINIPPPSVLPQTLPFILGASEIDILRCLFEKLKPANTKVIFKYY